MDGRLTQPLLLLLGLASSFFPSLPDLPGSSRYKTFGLQNIDTV
jgi:hypothetical protein